MSHRGGAAVVTGLGILVPGCDSRRLLWAHLIEGMSALAIAPVPGDPERRLAMGRVAGEEAGRLDELPEFIRERWSREQQLHFASVLLAKKDSKLDAENVDPERVGVYDGTSRANLDYLCERLRERADGKEFTRRDLVVGLPNHAAALAAVELGIRGPAVSFGASCASGAVAIAHATHAIERGDIDVAYASGHDTPLLAPVYEMYDAAGILSRESEDARQALSPFGTSSGTVFGEGSVTLALESRAHAERRGAEILASIVGAAHGNTGLHPMNVDTTGASPARLVERLLDRSGISPDEVDFVISHGNGVGQTYEAEFAFMRRVFGTRSGSVPMLSTKPNVGHMMAAASSLDVAATTLVLHHRRTFSTLNVDKRHVPDGMCHHAVPVGPHGLRYGLTLTFGMGGQIAAVLVAREPSRDSSRDSSRESSRELR